MPAYVIVNIEVHNPEQYAEYVRVVPEIVARFGGRYIARGGRTERLEGTWEPRRVVVLEFPSFEQARAWWDSEEYRVPKSLRQAASGADMILVEGV